MTELVATARVKMWAVMPDGTIKEHESSAFCPPEDWHLFVDEAKARVFAAKKVALENSAKS